MNKILTMALASTMTLFAMNKGMAQAQRSVLTTTVATEVNALPSGVKIMSDNELDKDASTMSQRTMNPEITMIGDTVIVQDDKTAEWLAKQPKLLSQIGQVHDLTSKMPKGSFAHFSVGSNLKELSVALYTQQQNIPKTAMYNSTPVKNLAMEHYDVAELDAQIMLNNLNNTPGDYNAASDVIKLRQALYEEKITFSNGFKPLKGSL